MRSLVLYFSVTGYTKKVAKEIAKQMGAHIVELQPIDSYSKDYKALMTRGINEINKGIKPQIHGIDIKLDDYDMIFIGSPNWLNTYAPVIGTFVDEYDIEGKIIVPFETYNQGEKGNMDKELRKHYVHSRVIDTIAIDKDCEHNLEKVIEQSIARKNLHNLNMPIKH